MYTVCVCVCGMWCVVVCVVCVCGVCVMCVVCVVCDVCVCGVWCVCMCVCEGWDGGVFNSEGNFLHLCLYTSSALAIAYQSLWVLSSTQFQPSYM